MQAVGAGAVVGKGNTYTPNVSQGRGASHVSEHERAKGKPAQSDPAKVQAAKDRTERIANSVKDNMKSIVAYTSSKESVQNKVAGAIQKKADQILKVSKEIEKTAPKIGNTVGNTVKTISKAVVDTSKKAGQIGNEARKVTRDVIKSVGKNTGVLSNVVEVGSSVAKKTMKAVAPGVGHYLNYKTIEKNDSNFKTMLAATDIVGDFSVVVSPITSTANLVGSLVYDALPTKGKEALDKAYDPNKKVPQHLIDIRTHNYKSTPHERSRRNNVNTNTTKSDNLKKAVNSVSSTVVKKSSVAPNQSVKTTSRNNIVRSATAKIKANVHTTSHIAAASASSTKSSNRTTTIKSTSRVVAASKRKVSSKSSSKSSSHSSSKKKSSSNSSKKSSARSSSRNSSRSSSRKTSSRSSSSRRSSSRSRRRH